MIMLNMVNLKEISVPDPVPLYVLHVMFILIVPILLLNFLIAMFSESAAQV